MLNRINVSHIGIPIRYAERNAKASQLGYADRELGRTAAMSQMLQIHARLRDMVLSLDLGPGERLSERLLEREFNGSRTPVRAALLKLEAEGLVCRDGRNWGVAPIDLRGIAAPAEFRLPLEETPGGPAFQRATAEELEPVQA